MLEIVDTNVELARLRREDEIERFQLGSVLTIELSSRFRNGRDALFNLLSLLLWSSIGLCVCLLKRP